MEVAQRHFQPLGGVHLLLELGYTLLPVFVYQVARRVHDAVTCVIGSEHAKCLGLKQPGLDYGHCVADGSIYAPVFGTVA